MKKRFPNRELSAYILLLCGIIMAFIALFLPPPGEIHSSVLYIFAQILIYAGSIFGIDAYVRKAIEQQREIGPPSRDRPSPNPPSRDRPSLNPPEV